MSTATPALPAVENVAARAKEILSAFEADREFAAFVTATLKYDSDWTCFPGTPIVSKYNQDNDKSPLLAEALRALCLKVAVYEMTYAMIAQPQLLARIAERIGVQTDQEHTDWRTGDYTHQAYTLAWGTPPNRYWIDYEEAQRRLSILNERYEAAGFLNMGLAHVIDFGEPARA